MASSSSKSRLASIFQNPGAEITNALKELDALSEAEPIVRPKRKTPTKSKKNDTGPGNGTGYGGNQSETVAKAVQDSLNRASKEEGAQDEKLKTCFERIRRNLPGALNGTSMLSKLKESKGFCSSFLQLLRNDSLLDIGSRMELYRSLLGVLLLLAKHPSTMEFLSHPLYEDLEDSSNNSSTCKQLLSSLGAQAKVFLQLQGKPVKSPSKKRKAEDEVEIVEMDESIVMATIITDTVRAVDSFIDLTLDSADTPTTAKRESSSGGVVDLTLDDGDDFIVWVPPPSTSSNTSSTDFSSSSSSSITQSASKRAKTETTAEALQREESEYSKHLVPLRFEVIDMCALIASGQVTHVYSSQSGASQAQAASAQAQLMQLQQYGRAPAPAPSVSTNPKQRMTRIAKEMATLSTNLPVEFGSSVFVRVDESRMDLIKALIIGPQGTPYANGCFEFDIYLPGDYPNRPPQVLLRTTGQGTVRFNPNLYNCGKVCLSLLGTWAGPGWDPKLSTLLQVLVSIQSLILVPDPFYNEPGYQVGKHLNESAAYSKNIQKQTLQHAILGQLTTPSVVFANVIRAHFTHKKLSLAAQLAEWSREVPAAKPLATKIQAELNKLV